MACHFAKLACHLPTTEATLAKQHFPHCIIKSKWRWRWFCGAGTDCGRKRKSPISIDFLFLKQAVHASLRCEVSDNHVPYPALYSFLRLACSIHPSANAFLLYFPVISVFLCLDLFPFLLKDIKIAVINISPIYNVWNVTTAITFFCYSVSVKLSLLSVYFSITAILFCRKFQTGHAINSPVS